MYQRLAVLVVLLAVLLTVLFWSKRGGSGGGAKPSVRVETREGVPVVRLRGPSRAKGRGLGEALRDRIRRELARALPDAEGLREFAVRACGEKLSSHLPPHLRLEIEGLAEGAGIAFEEALFLDTRFEISAFGLAAASGELPSEGAVGPGAEASCLLPAEAARDLVVVVHEDLDPPLVLVTRPGMTGAFLGARGDVAAVMRPIREAATPPLSGLVWTLFFRRVLEEAPEEPRVPGTGPLSVAMTLPDGGAATLSLGVSGAAWYRGSAGHSLTTDEPAVPRRAGTTARRDRDAAAQARVAEDAARLLAGPVPPAMARVSLRGDVLVLDGAEGRRTVFLGER
jgi:hypothetical protein